MSTATGHDTKGGYLWEDDGSGNPDFNNSPDDSDIKPFGADATISSNDGTNNAIRVFEPGTREAVEIIETVFEGSWTADYTLTNPWWLRGVIADPSSSGTGPTTHTYDGDVPFPLRILQPTDTTGKERVLKGCVIGSCTIETGVGGEVTVSLDGAYADEDLVDTPQLSSQPALNHRPMHFGQASMSLGGTTKSLVQNVSVTIENNVDLLRELGSRFAVAYSPKKRTADVSYGDIVEDSTELERMYGGSTEPQAKVQNKSDIVVSFDNGETGSAKNSLTLNLNQAFPDQYGRSGVGDPEADIEGNISELAMTVDAVAENDVSTAR